MPKLIITGNKCTHNTLAWNPGPYTEEYARQRAAEIIKEFDTHGGDDSAVAGSPEGPPNGCGYEHVERENGIIERTTNFIGHRIIEEP